MALVTESYEFIRDNGLEWFPPNLLLGACLWILLAIPAGAWPMFLAKMAILALFLYFAMIVRGFLFEELAGSTRRSRVFRWKAGS
jgi:hypothetical protein